MFNCFWRLPLSRFSPTLSLLASTWPPPCARISPSAPLPPPSPLMFLCNRTGSRRHVTLFYSAKSAEDCFVQPVVQDSVFESESYDICKRCKIGQQPSVVVSMLLGVSSGAADPRAAFRPRCRCRRDLRRRVQRKISECAFEWACGCFCGAEVTDNECVSAVQGKGARHSCASQDRALLDTKGATDI